MATLNYWRHYFASSGRNSPNDIFDIINGAIMVATSDHPKEFKVRRDGLAERLFSTDHSSDERVGKAKHMDVEEILTIKEMLLEKVSGTFESIKSLELVANQIDGGKDALLVGEVLKIKEIILEDIEGPSDEDLMLETLTRLELMSINVKTLKTTGIGKIVNDLRKHGSKSIQDLARKLVAEWKVMADYELLQPSVFPKENRNHQVIKKQEVVKPIKPLESKDTTGSSTLYSGKPPIEKSIRLMEEQRMNDEKKIHHQPKSDKPSLVHNRRPISAQRGEQDKFFKRVDQVTEDVKLQAPKRKFHEDYHQAEKGKKQRTVKVLDMYMRDLSAASKLQSANIVYRRDTVLALRAPKRLNYESTILKRRT